MRPLPRCVVGRRSLVLAHGRAPLRESVDAGYVGLARCSVSSRTWAPAQDGRESSASRVEESYDLPQVSGLSREPVGRRRVGPHGLIVLTHSALKCRVILLEQHCGKAYGGAALAVPALVEPRRIQLHRFKPARTDWRRTLLGELPEFAVSHFSRCVGLPGGMEVSVCLFALIARRQGSPMSDRKGRDVSARSGRGCKGNAVPVAVPVSGLVTSTRLLTT
jgi:hypothetical protein